jgi:hypothetical protein
MKHISTAKHNRRINPNEKMPETIYECDCGKQYKHMSSLCNHKKHCLDILKPHDNHPSLSVNNNVDKEMLILELLKQNVEFQKLMTKETSELKHIISEQNQKMLEIAGNMGNNHHNNINSNNKFNLNVFLNEKCKNAMSLTDFVNSMNLTIEDFIQTGERGFIDGISNIIIDRIHNMDLHDRPLHCTDLKRETVYIKDSDKWEKDEDKVRLRKAVKCVAYKNERMRPIWYEETPEVDILGSENCEKFFKYSESALGGCGKEETKAFEDKVIRNILKESVIDKNILDN